MNYTEHNIGDELTIIGLGEGHPGLSPTVQRLYEMGLYPGLTVKILHILNYRNIFVLSFDENSIALNRKEFLCLKF